MNILFDQTEAQTSYYNGAAEYAQTLFLQLVSLLGDYPDVTLYSLYTSERSFKYEALSPESLRSHIRVVPVDYSRKRLKDIISENNIDLLFVTCAQTFCDLPLGNLSHLGCKVVAVIHDMYVEEMASSHIEYLHYIKHPGRFLYNCLGRIKVRLLSGTTTARAKLMVRLIGDNDSEIVTVSDYSRQAIRYFLPEFADKIHVFYAPMKTCPDESTDICNGQLKELVDNHRKYYLLLSADRITKNGERMLNAFKQFAANADPSALIVTTGCKKSLFSNHVALPFLSSSDINKAYRHCHALLYPSLFEGFGYPPVEAMSYGKPVLSSNVCSIPEVLGDSPVYFTPIYESSMYGALLKFNDMPYDKLAEKATNQYLTIKARQEADLQNLATKLMNGYFIKLQKQ